MATLRIELQRTGGRRFAADWRLDLAALARPVAAAGRDWLRLQGNPAAADAEAFAGWVAGDDDDAGRDHPDDGRAAPQDDLLRVELRAPAARRGARPWEGTLPRRELSRIAVRAAMARSAAGLWPRWSTARGDRLRCRLVLGADDPRAPLLQPLPAPADGPSRLGIRWQPAPAAAPPAPIPATAMDAWQVRQRLCPGDRTHPDVVLAFRSPIWDAVRVLGAESARRGEERGLLLYGARLRLRCGAEFAPWFDVTAVERPQHLEASAGALVLAHQALLPRRDGSRFVGMLHTHLQGVGVEPSDPDRRDAEDLDHGGPAAVSIVCEALPAAATAAPRLSVLCRIGRRGGRIDTADARVLVVDRARAPALPARSSEVNR
ncbi:MAG: hypothetical protein AB7O97_20185 [Planctomycetota bacterium]